MQERGPEWDPFPHAIAVRLEASLELILERHDLAAGLVLASSTVPLAVAVTVAIAVPVSITVPVAAVVPAVATVRTTTGIAVRRSIRPRIVAAA